MKGHQDLRCGAAFQLLGVGFYSFGFGVRGLRFRVSCGAYRPRQPLLSQKPEKDSGSLSTALSSSLWDPDKSREPREVCGGTREALMNFLLNYLRKKESTRLWALL